MITRKEKQAWALAIAIFTVLIVAAKLMTGQTPPPTRTFLLPDLSKEQTDGVLMLITGVVSEDKKVMSVLYNTSLEKITISGGIHYEWLTVQRSNTKAFDAKGFDASYVSITSDFKPVSVKRADGKWETHYETDL